MFFNARSLFKSALVAAFVAEATAVQLTPISQPTPRAAVHKRDPLDFKPITNPGDAKTAGSKRAAKPALELRAIEHPTVLTHGENLHKRQSTGNEIYDPQNHHIFYWGASTNDDIYVANFTLYAPGDNEFILPLDNFAKDLKSVNCGNNGTQPFTIEFPNSDSYNYAKGQWGLVNQANTTLKLVTDPNQCYEGDDRSPYLVTGIKFDDANLKAELAASEKEWADIAQNFHLKLNHETATNTSAPAVKRDDTGSKSMDIGHTFTQNLFNYDKATGNGLSIKADANIVTSGQLIADLDISTSWGIPTDASINVHPKSVEADFTLDLNIDGTLGKELQWTLNPEINIPIEALSIGKLLSLGPFVTLSVNFGTTQLSGTATASCGVKANIDDSAKVQFDLKHPDQNSISGWTPKFSKIDPSFSASVSGGVKAWVDLGVKLEATVLNKWGYEAGIDAQLPYFEADFAAQADTKGVCGGDKVVGIELTTDVGIDVNLNAGEINKDPTYSKDLFNTNWPLFSTCIGVGKDKPSSTSTPTPSSAKASSTKAASSSAHSTAGGHNSTVVATSTPKASAKPSGTAPITLSYKSSGTAPASHSGSSSAAHTVVLSNTVSSGPVPTGNGTLPIYRVPVPVLSSTAV